MALPFSNPNESIENELPLPTLLRGTAYVSTGGRVYRLFSDEEEETLESVPFNATESGEWKAESENGELEHTYGESVVHSPLSILNSPLPADPAAALKLFEAFSDNTAPRLKKQFVSEEALAFKKTQTVSLSLLETPPAVAADFHCPAYLKKLENTAFDQICSLAEHLEAVHRQGRKTISFNTLHVGDGCTTICLCAARELAKRNYRVLLADAHPQYPELPDLLGLSIDPNLYELISLIPNRLDLLPWSETFLEFDEQNGANARTFADVVAALKGDYDFLLLDNGCLLDKVSNLSEQWAKLQTDGVLLVLNPQHPAPFKEKDIASKILKQCPEFIGIIENFV